MYIMCDYKYVIINVYKCDYADIDVYNEIFVQYYYTIF